MKNRNIRLGIAIRTEEIKNKFQPSSVATMPDGAERIDLPIEASDPKTAYCVAANVLLHKDKEIDEKRGYFVSFKNLLP